jgi:hypothetical protein
LIGRQVAQPSSVRNAPADEMATKRRPGRVGSWMIVPYRTFDILDMGANALGAMVGYAGALTVLLLVIRPASESEESA